MLSKNFKTYCQKLLKIKSKQNDIVSLRFNYIQEHLYQTLKEPVKCIILKSRQMGCSTFCLSYLFYKVMTTPNYRAIVATHNFESSKLMLAIARFYYENLPVELKPVIEFDNVRLMTFPELGSELLITASKSQFLGRGIRVSGILLSEIAFYQDSKLITSILGSLPPTGDIFIESTANGIGNEFYTLYQKARRGEINFQHYFFPWYSQPEYRYKLYQALDLTPEENELKQKYNLTQEQIYWRRERIAIYGKAQFAQEFPANPDEAFAVSSNQVFDLKNLTNYIEEPQLKAELLPTGLTETSNGRLKIFRKPVSDNRYVIGLDTSEGRNDRSIIMVLDIHNNEQVAIYDLLIDPDLLAIYTVRLAKLYNNARICPEINSSGLTTLSAILRGSPEHRVPAYRNIYRKQNIEQGYDSLTSYGWRTTRNSKIVLIDEIQSYIRKNNLIIHEEETLEELRNYQRFEDGKTGAPSGCFDDRVVSLGLCLQAKINYNPIPIDENLDLRELDIVCSVTAY